MLHNNNNNYLALTVHYWSHSYCLSDTRLSLWLHNIAFFVIIIITCYDTYSN